jgi:probable HAF family extracellular repeat protein
LYGLAGNDRLFGLAGNDRLFGGTGNDRLFGETGNDPRVRRHGFLWEKGKMTDLTPRETPMALNDRGQVVGLDWGQGGGWVWQDGRSTEIDFTPHAINGHGQVIGTNWEGPHNRAFVWVDGDTFDLGTLPGGKSSDAVAINEQGQIVGWSTTGNGQQHAVLWTPKRG